jgi:hypothetical protein
MFDDCTFRLSSARRRAVTGAYGVDYACHQVSFSPELQVYQVVPTWHIGYQRQGFGVRASSCHGPSHTAAV